MKAKFQQTAIHNLCAKISPKVKSQESQY